MPTTRRARRHRRRSRRAPRRGAALLFVAALAVSLLAACGGDDGTTTPATTAATTPATTPGDTVVFKPVTPNTLTIVTSLPGPGFFEGSDDDPTKLDGGYEFAIADRIRQKLGLEQLLIRNESFDAIIGGQLGGYDLALSQVSITPMRSRMVDFTKPYFSSEQGALVKAGAAPLDTLDQARGLLWGVRAGTTALTLLTQQVRPTKSPLVFPELSDAYSALEGGQVDAVLVDMAINLGEAARSDGRFTVVAQFRQPDGPDEYGGVVPKGSPNLPIFDALITDMDKTGELKKLAGEYLTKDPVDIPEIGL